MSKTLPGDEITFLHTHPYNLNSPLEKIDPGEKNSEPYPFQRYLKLGALHDARTLTYPGHETDRHHLTPGHERQWTLHSNDKEGRQMDPI